MTTIVVLFNLLPEVDPDAYEAWAREVDMPNARRLPGCNDFQVLRVVSLFGSQDAAPYAYCELIEVDDMPAFEEAVGTEAMQAVAAEFQRHADNPIFMVSESLEQ